MNIFDLRDRLVKNYADYVKSFILIQDGRIRSHVDENLEDGLLWPDPLIQMNPSFEPGEWIDELVQQQILHEECSRIFRIKQDPQEEGNPLRLHRHQSDAVKAAKTENNYVLTTGTGSGKSAVTASRTVVQGGAASSARRVGNICLFAGDMIS